MRAALFLVLVIVATCAAHSRRHCGYRRMRSPSVTELSEKTKALIECVLSLKSQGIRFHFQPYRQRRYCLEKSRLRLFYLTLKYNLERCKTMTTTKTTTPVATTTIPATTTMTPGTHTTTPATTTTTPVPTTTTPATTTTTTPAANTATPATTMTNPATATTTPVPTTTSPATNTTPATTTTTPATTTTTPATNTTTPASTTTTLPAPTTVSVFKDCSEVLAAGNTADDVYEIKVDGVRRNVFCDMTTDGGGWTVYLRRGPGNTVENFHRSAAEYANGFGDPKGEHWAGNELVHDLTSMQSYILRIDMTNEYGIQGTAVYNTFSVGSVSTDYMLTVGGFDAGKSNVYDALGGYNGQAFSAKDSYNDNNPDITGIIAYELGGGFWYHLSGITAALTVTRDPQQHVNMIWSGFGTSLTSARMMFRPSSI